MQSMIGRREGGDAIDPLLLPPPSLALVVGELDHAVWLDLEPDNEEHEHFLGPYFLQGDWDWATHTWFWKTNLKRWPRDLRKRSTSGLVSQRVAVWRRAGYSRTQIADALWFRDKNGRPSVTPRIWELANDYRDWLAERPLFHPADLGAQRYLEDRWAETAERSGGPAAAESYRHNYRNLERTPRVITVEERGRSAFARFGHPEEFSTAFLDEIDPSRPIVGANLDRADIVLRKQEPRGAAPRAERRPHLTTPRTMA